MPRTRTGLSYLNPPKSLPTGRSGIFAARVEYVIMNNIDDPKVFKRYGGWDSIGTAFFSRMDQPSNKENFELYNYAKPLFSNVKNYPLLNEVIYIISLPSSITQNNIDDVSYYYFQSINIWNNNHHNALPNAISLEIGEENINPDYAEIEAGLRKKPKEERNEITLGNTFIERSNIKPLQSFEGDIIHEGRWGQSLRFGSTVRNSSIFNPWSTSGTNGDPITILRNNQYNDGTDPWIPQVENIDEDESSIYLTSTQQIPIDVASNSYKSFDPGLEPISVKTYSDSQIILNSGRLLLNSHTDSILLTSNDSINLNARETVNIDAIEGFSVSVGNDGEVLLGSNDFGVIEPVILGDKFLSDVQNLANILVELGNNFELNPMLTSDEKANAKLLNIGGNLKQSAQNILNNIENYKSKVTFSK